MKPYRVSTAYVQSFVSLVVFATLIQTSTVVADSSSTPVVVYGQSGQSSPRYRTWNGSSWGSEQSMPSIGATPYWIVVRNCPTRDEYTCVTQDSAADLNVLFSSGSSWGSATQICSDIGSTAYRKFDVAYESQSGDMLVAYWDYAGSERKIGYRTYNGSSLSSESLLSLPSTNSVSFVRLVPSPTTDQIFLFAINTGRDLYTSTWNGSSWSSVSTLETNVPGYSVECFDAAWESSGNQAVVVYSQSGSSNPRTRTWNGSSWSSESSMSSIGSTVYWIQLMADPNSDKILLGMQDSSNDINVFSWSGSAWSSPSQIESSTSQNNRRQFDIAFEPNASGEALICYNQSGQNAFRYRTWNGSAWSSEQSGTSFNDEPQTLRIHAGDSGSDVHLVSVIADSDVESTVWNGSSFGSALELESNGISQTYICYALGGPTQGASLTPADLPYANDFEGVVGAEWSTSDTDYDADFSTFLGRFNKANIDLALNTTVGEKYQLEFDFYAIDSWNPYSNNTEDILEINANGSQIFYESFTQRPSEFDATFQNPWDVEGALGFGTRSNTDDDGIYRSVTVVFVAVAPVTTLSFSDSLNSDMNDESWGIDNVSITAARFIDVSTTRGFDVSTSTDTEYASGLHFFDADGDGDVDAIIGGNQAKRMLNGGTSFVASSFGSGNERRQHALFDMDNDGDIDFWSGNHNSYYVEACYENNGSGGFSDVGDLGFDDPNNNEGVAVADVDRDGWCDIVHFCENDNWIGHHQGDPGASLPSLVGTNDDKYGLSNSGDVGNGDYASAGDVNNDGYLDFFYHYNGGKLFISNGDGTYTENVHGINVFTGQDDKFGSAWADYDNDGDLDLYCARWDNNNKGYLWRNDITWGGKSISGSFTNQSDDAAINDESGQFGCAWGDYDNDGDLDLYVATRSGPNKLYQNQGDGTFRMMDEGAGVTGKCQDVVFVDYDNDGDLDIAVTREDDTAVLLENRTNNDNYLKVRVVGQGGGGTNMAAVGVRVELWNKQGTQRLGRREIGVARGLGTEPLWAHFGGVDPTQTYQVWTYLHSRDNSNPLVTTVVPQNTTTTIGSTTIPQMLTVTEENAKKRVILWREVLNRS